MLSTEKLDPHQEVEGWLKQVTCSAATPAPPLVMFFVLASAKYVKNNQSLQSDCSGRAVCYNESLMCKLISKVLERLYSCVF